MKINFVLLYMCIHVLFSSCNAPDTSGEKKGEEVVGVRSEKLSDLVRMPASASDEVDTTLAAKFQFDETLYSFDTIFEGDVVRHAFNFKNIGKTSLVISDVKSSCGCTVPYFSKEPVLPGDSGVVEVKFDSEGKINKQTKGVTIYANTYPNKTMLRVFGYVIPKGNQ
jgi:hypothetical protein